MNCLPMGVPQVLPLPWDSSQFRRSSFSVSGSPPDIRTSRTVGVDRMYSMAYYTDPANTLEQAQVDKKALIAFLATL